MAMTTSNSISVNPVGRFFRCEHILYLLLQLDNHRISESRRRLHPSRIDQATVHRVGASCQVACDRPLLLKILASGLRGRQGGEKNFAAAGLGRGLPCGMSAQRRTGQVTAPNFPAATCTASHSAWKNSPSRRGKCAETGALGRIR
ncbi:hypothetical protein HRbin36_00077 [bacterium HR36]|nr:hypothetical protein HRbin36_00077 [bacterium HR36]